MNPRDAYLAWQADIGTEEVILAQPWIRPRPAPRPDGAASTASSAFAAPSSAELQGHGRSPAVVPASAGMTTDFFQSIAASLARPEISAKTTRAVQTAAAPPPASSTVSAFPEFRDLAAYWEYLEAFYSQGFPGTGILARAEGLARPTLAVVELFPAGGRVFGGEAGEFLDKMMKGIGLTRDRLYLTSVMKTAPGGKAWARKDVARMLPAFFQELRLAECGLVLLLGEACAQSVLRTGQALPALAETAVNHGNMTMVAAEHPAHLMNSDDATRRTAWNQLKWLRARLPAVNS